MSTKKGEVIELVRKSVQADQLKRSVVYWDSRVIKSGTTVDLGGQQHNILYDCTLAFVDLAPNFNWAHPCLHLLIREDKSEAEQVKDSFPPRRRGFPDDFKVILRFGKEISGEET